MQINGGNRIGKLVVDVTTSTAGHGHQLKDNVRSFIDDCILPAIEAYFDSLESSLPEGEVLQIDRLVVEVGGQRSDWDTNELERKIRGEFGKALQRNRQELTSLRVGKTPASRVRETPPAAFEEEEDKQSRLNLFSPSQLRLDAWLHFLEHGSRPWWAGETHLAPLLQETALLKTLQEDRQKGRKALSGKLESETVRKRLIHQFSDDFLSKLLPFLATGELSESSGGMTEGKTTGVKEWMAHIAKGTSGGSRTAFWETALAYVNASVKGSKPSDQQLVGQLAKLVVTTSRMAGQVPDPNVIVSGLKLLHFFAGKKETEGYYNRIAKEIHTDSGTTTNPGKVSSAKGERPDTAVDGMNPSPISIAEQSFPGTTSEATTGTDTPSQDREQKRAGRGEESSGDQQTTAGSTTAASDAFKQEKNDLHPDRSPDKQHPERQLSAGEEGEQPQQVVQLKGKNDPVDSDVPEPERSSVVQDDDQPATDVLSKNQENVRANAGEKSSGNETEKKELIRPETSDTNGQTVQDDGSTEDLRTGAVKEIAPDPADAVSRRNPEASQEMKTETSTDAANASHLHERDGAKTTNGHSSETGVSQEQQSAGTTSGKEAVSGHDEQASWPEPTGMHVMVDNAGLMLVHPFLKHLFTNTGLLTKNNTLTDKVLAAHVLHYIATGRENDYEHTMLLEKYLTGIPMTESIPREVAISAEIKAEADGLLEAVKQNWKPMKGSSHDAIRETFLNRQGKLIDELPYPRMIIERKTVDILLNQLSWTISIIRLPWMDKLIYVEW